jgi:type VI secretion system protein
MQRGLIPLLLTGLLALAACGQALVKTKIVLFEVDEAANLNHPIAVDLVIIYDEKLLEEITALSAHDWFTKRAQLKRDYPISLSTWEWEFVPGQKSQELLSFKMPSEVSRAQGALLFASYVTPGQHRMRLDTFEGVKVWLQTEEVVLLSYF